MKKLLFLLFLFSVQCFFAYSQNPTYDWTKQIGGANASIDVSRIATDNEGNVIYIGRNLGSVDIDLGPGTTLTSGGSINLVIAKYDRHGSLIWTKEIIKNSNGSTDQISATEIVVNQATNEIIISGEFKGDYDFDPSGAITQISSPQNNYASFIAKYTACGDLVWVNSYKEAAGNAGSHYLAVNPTNNVLYAAGIVYNGIEDNITSNLIVPGNGNLGETYILKLDLTNGSILNSSISKIVSPSANDHNHPGDIEVDPNTGDVYLAGYITGVANVFGTWAITASTEDLCLVRLDANLNYQNHYLTQAFNASFTDASIKVLSNSDIVFTAAQGDPNAVNVPFSSFSISGLTRFASRSDPNFNFQWLTNISITPNNLGIIVNSTDMDIDNLDNIYLIHAENLNNQLTFLTQLDGSGNTLSSNAFSNLLVHPKIATNKFKEFFFTNGEIVAPTNTNPLNVNQSITPIGIVDAFITKMSTETYFDYDVRVLIEEFYIDGNTTAPLMKPVLVNSQVAGFGSNDVDEVTINLRQAAFPYSIIASSKGILQDNAQLHCIFPSSLLGGSYWIEVIHRNSVSICSAAPVLINSGALSYDFMLNPANIYGGASAVVKVHTNPDYYAMYSGDACGGIDACGNTIPDENIQVDDYNCWDIDYQNNSIGYIITDFNGDGNVDILDWNIWDTNYNLSPFSPYYMNPGF